MAAFKTFGKNNLRQNARGLVGEVYVLTRIVFPFVLAVATFVFAVSAFGADTEDNSGADDAVFLGEVDLAERAEIWRNQYRRMTPGDEPLIQDVGAWPAAWEEFGSRWGAAPATRDLATWLVPFSAERTGNATVIRDANGTVLWSGTTDFAKDSSANVSLTGNLVDEADWPLYDAARGEIDRRMEEVFSPVFLGGTRGSNGPITNGLRFTNMWWETNGDYRLDFAWEEDGDVQVFCRPMHSTSWVETVVWTNDENEVSTNDFTRWRQLDRFKGRPDAWTLLGVATVTNGGGSFTDTTAVPDWDRVRFYAAAKLGDVNGNGITDGEEWLWGITSTTTDTDNDGLSDYQERKFHGTDPDNPDTDGDGWTDGEEILAGTDPLDRLDATRPARGVLVHAVKYACDAGDQWVQLHCSGPRAVDVSGFRIQTAGTNWETVATLPGGTWMVPGHFLLAGGEGVTNADLTATLSLAGSYSGQPTVGVRLMAPEGSTSAPVDTMFYGTHVPFNEQGLDTAGWLSVTTNLWASSTRHLERWSLGLDTDRENDWRHAADGDALPCNTSSILDSDGDDLTDETEYLEGFDPLDPDTDDDGLLDGFEKAENLLPDNSDSDGDGTLDGDEIDPETQQPYEEKQRADGVTVSTVGPAGWTPGGDLGLGGVVTYTLTDVAGFAVWGTILELGFTNEDYDVSVENAYFSLTWEIHPTPGRKYVKIFAAPNGTNELRVVVTDNSANAGVSNPDDLGADIAGVFRALRLNAMVGNVPEENDVSPGAFLPNRVVHSNAPRTKCRLTVPFLPLTTAFPLPRELSLEWDGNIIRVYPEDCPEDGTPLEFVTAPLQMFWGTNVWLEGAVTTNIFLDWRWDNREYGQDRVKATVYEVRFQTYPDTEPGPDKPHEKNIQTRQNESSHYGNFTKCVSHVWSQAPCDLTQYLEGHENADLLAFLQNTLRWKIGNGSWNAEYELPTGNSSPSFEKHRLFNVQVAFCWDEIPLDWLVLTVIPTSSLTYFQTWHTAESTDTAWLETLPAPYSTLVMDNGNNHDPEGSGCALWRAPKSINTYYHPDGFWEMRSEIVANGHGHQAVYDEGGNLITNGISAGSADKSSPWEDVGDHIDWDVVPFVIAAQIDGNPVDRGPWYLLEWDTMTAPVMHFGARLHQYLECRPTMPNDRQPLQAGLCPEEEE